MTLKDSATPRFGHSDVVFYLFIEMSFAFNHSLIQFFKTYLFRYHWTKIIRLYVKSTINSVHQAFLLMIDRRYLLTFVTKNGQKATSLSPNHGVAASLKSEADALSG